ncbi:hypothetical protein N9L70_05720, partial [Rhodobacteraceae bacterium]|nr:hypothetical protein [Paracoccaceae bacterium]
DAGEFLQDPTTFILTRMQARVDDAAAELGGDDVWIGGIGEHIGNLGTGDDTVRLADGRVTLLLDHGLIDRAVNGDLREVRDLNPTSGGNDTATVGAGFGMILGGAGNDRILAGRTADGGLNPDDGAHIIFGDTGIGLFDPDLEGSMNPERIETRLPDVIGNDVIRSGVGRDVALGGGGDDDINSEDGRDFVAGDFLHMTYQDGLVLEVRTPYEEQLLGGADTLRTGYDFDEKGDFIFGGTQFNRFGTASSVDITFETFGRVLFEPGEGIEKVFRVLSEGVAGSYLNDRVRDGQVSSSYGAARLQENGKNTAPVVAGTNYDTFDEFVKTFRMLSGGTGGNEMLGSFDSGFSAKSQTTVLVTPVAEPQQAAPNDEQATEPDLDLTPDAEQATESDPQAEAEPVHDQPPNTPSVEVKTPEIEQAYSIVEEEDDMISMMALAILPAAAGSVRVGGVDYRRFGPRRVGSLEQRLRVWNSGKFELRG